MSLHLEEKEASCAPPLFALLLASENWKSQRLEALDADFKTHHLPVTDEMGDDDTDSLAKSRGSSTPTTMKSRIASSN